MPTMAQGMAALVMLACLFVLAQALDDMRPPLPPAIAAQPVCTAPVEVDDGPNARLGCADEPALFGCQAQALDRVRVTDSGCQVEHYGMRPAWWLLTEHKLDINRATAETLHDEARVGEKLAQAIVAERDANGLFQSPNDWLRVPGIGPKKAEQLQRQMTVLR